MSAFPGMIPREGPDEAGRRVVSVVHLAMLSAIPLYAGVLWMLAPAPAPRDASGRALPWILLAIGGAEFAAATVLGAGLLRASGGRSGGPERVRRYFLVRFAAAEAIALFGLVVGLRGASWTEAGALFAASVLALVAAAPTRAAWGRASAGNLRGP